VDPRLCHRHCRTFAPWVTVRPERKAAHALERITQPAK
jgi:hypothetical protein